MFNVTATVLHNNDFLDCLTYQFSKKCQPMKNVNSTTNILNT